MIKKSPLKVHQLAKELGVNSKEIIARCKTEEIDGIESHLSPVSVGLAATIREWFGGGGGVATATEAASPAAPAAADPTPAPVVAPTPVAASKTSGGTGTAPVASAGGSATTAGTAPVAASGAAPVSTADGKAHRKVTRTTDAGASTTSVSAGAGGSAPTIAGPRSPTLRTSPSDPLAGRSGAPTTDAPSGAGADSATSAPTARQAGGARPFSSTPSGVPSAGSPTGATAPASGAAGTSSDVATLGHTGGATRGGGPSTVSTGGSSGAHSGASGSSSPTIERGHGSSAGPATQGSSHAGAPGTSVAHGGGSSAPGSTGLGTGSGAASTGGSAGSAGSSGASVPATPLRPAARAPQSGHHAGPRAGDAPPAGGPAKPTSARPDAKGDPRSEPRGDGPSSPRTPTMPPPNFAPYVTPTMNVPKRPDIVKPVGPKLESPTKTVMSGPKVIRIEAPEQLPTPRPRSSTGTGGPVRVGRPGGTAGPAGRDDRARAGRGAATGRRDDAAGRSGRLARADRGTTAGEPWRQQDLREREDRLSRSEGFFKTHKRDPVRSRGPGSGPGGRAGGRDESQPVHISEPLTIKDLSAATGVKAADILKRLFLSGTVATINSAIDREKAMDVMMDFDIELIVEESKSAAEIIESRFEEREAVDVRPRAPVVTILGHVDHGKTSLLDKIRNANVAAGEAGGITQKTSAFTVPVKAGERDRVVTFIDTPGHEAFTNMRARGAKVTDIAVLVVAADDGVMPQTVESIAHARAADVPIVVALNKIDKPEATEENIRRILGQLAEKELSPTEWGGTTEVVKTSAIKGVGIQDLLDILDYQAELLGLTADFGGSARGTVLEAKMEEGRGAVASVLVQEGTLKKGDFIVVGRGFGRVRDLVNDRGQRITEAGPSTPIAISGMDVLPDAGDKFFVVESLKAAEEAAEERRRLDRERELAAPKVTLDTFFASLEKGKKKDLSLVVKADSQGSVEALRAELSKIGTDEVLVSVKHCAVGGITESDVMLAEATKATIVGFNVTSSAKARGLAETKGIEIRLYDVIYDLKDDVVKAASGLLAPEIKLEVLGHAEVRQVFKISKVGMIAGCYVLDGVIERNAQIRVTRNGIVVEKDRRLEQLKRFKDDAKDVRAGQECGMKIVGYDDIKSGDVLECYKTVQVARTL